MNGDRANTYYFGDSDDDGKEPAPALAGVPVVAGEGTGERWLSNE